MIDIDDSRALNTLKTLKATEQANDLILQSGNRLEDEALRQEAARVAHENSQRKRQAIVAAKVR